MHHRLFPHKIKNRTAIWSTNPTSGNISKRIKSRGLKRCLHTHVHRGTSYSIQGGEAAQCLPTDTPTHKMWQVRILLEYYSTLTRKETLAHSTTRLTPCGQRAEWDGPVIERPTLCDCTWARCPQYEIHRNKKYKVAPGGWGKGGGQLFRASRVTGFARGDVLEICFTTIYWTVHLNG